MATNQIQPYAFEPRRQFVEESDDSGNSGESEGTESSEYDEVRVGNVSWCTCKHCRTMSTERESICCCEMGELNEKLDGKDSVNFERNVKKGARMRFLSCVYI